LEFWLKEIKIYCLLFLGWTPLQKVEGSLFLFL